MARNEVLSRLLTDIHAVCEVFRDRHVVYTGSDHGDGYVNYRALGKPEHLPLLRRTVSFLLESVVAQVNLDRRRPVWVMGPETLGAEMACQAFQASDSLLINVALFKKDGDNKVFRFKPSKRLLSEPSPQIIWVDDLLNAGTTWDLTRPLLEAHNLKASAIGVIGDRSGLAPGALGVPVVSLEQFTLKRYPEKDCPLCRDREPILRKPGHGYKFEEVHPDYPGGFVDV